MTPSPALVEAIREHDRSGRVVATGAEWLEENRSGMFFLAVPIMGSVIGFIASVTFLIGGKDVPQALMVMAICVGVFVLACAIAPSLCMDKRALVFRRDGSAYVTRGIPFDRRSGDLAWTQDIFRSIEVRDTRERGYAVDIHTSEGDAIMIGWKMSDATARKLAVQLNKALRELREATARDALDLTPEAALAMAGRAMHGYHNGAATAEFVID